MFKPHSVDKVLPYALLGMTAVTGLIDAVSYLALGHVFTANMTGNLVFLAFASTGAAEVSLTRTLSALLAFLVGAAVSGRILASTGVQYTIRPAMFSFGLETALLSAATVSAVGYNRSPASVSFQLYSIIVLTAVAMGIRNAAVRKLGVPDLTTTVLTLTVTGLAADSSLAGGSNPRWQRRTGSILAMVLGAALGAIIVKHSVFAALCLAAATSLICFAALLFSVRWNSSVEPVRTAQQSTV
jgi:uncharacterized membrane protein YoaK (UPF0700 family)